MRKFLVSKSEVDDADLTLPSANNLFVHLAHFRSFVEHVIFSLASSLRRWIWTKHSHLAVYLVPLSLTITAETTQFQSARCVTLTVWLAYKRPLICSIPWAWLIGSNHVLLDNVTTLYVSEGNKKDRSLILHWVTRRYTQWRFAFPRVCMPIRFRIVRTICWYI